MTTILLDTDVAIDFLRGLDYAKNIIVPLWQKDSAFISILTVYELFAGMRPTEENRTNDFIQACHIEPISLEITKTAGEYYRNYRKQGITLTSVDCLIGATAKTQGHQLATRNHKHYPDKTILLALNSK